MNATRTSAGLRRVVAMLCGIVLVFAAAACGSDSSSGSGGKKEIVIGSVVPTLENPFWQRYVAFQKQAASQLGFKLVVVDGQNDGTKMLNAAQNLISRKVDGLIHVAYFDTGRPVLTAAKKADIPVAIADTSPEGIEPQSSGFDNYIAFMGPNDEQAGHDEAIALFKAAAAGGGTVNVFGLEGTLGTSVNEGRVQGLKSAVDESDGVTLTGTQTGNFLRDEALNVTTNALQANGDINAIWSANDDMSIGALQALKRAKKTPGKDVYVSGMDLNGDAIEAVKNGEMVITLGGHWLQGGFLAGIMYDQINGKKIPADKAVIKLDLLGVTKENVATFESQFPDGQPSDYDFKSHSQVYTKGAPPADYALPPIG
jgi:ABC-type sugar transport system substrate-binding protein